MSEINQKYAKTLEQLGELKAKYEENVEEMTNAKLEASELKLKV